MRKSNPKRIIPVLLLAGLVVWWLQSLVVAARDARALVANGTIEADEIEVGAQRAARLVRFEAEEGASVKAGGVIARLDSSELNAQLEQASGAAEALAAKLAQLLKGTREEEIRASRGQLAHAQAGVAGARRSLSNAQLGYSHRTALKQALDAAETQQAIAAETLRQAERAETGTESAHRIATEEHETSLQLKQQRDLARQQLDAAQAGLRQARAHLTQLLNGARLEQVRQAEASAGQAKANVQGAREELKNATTELARAKEQHASRAITDQMLDITQTRFEVARAKLTQTEQSLKQAEEKLAELRNGARAEEVEAAQAAVQQAQAIVEGGQRSLANAQQAHELRLGARGTMNAAKTQRDLAQVQVASAKAALAGAELAVKNARLAYSDALGEKQSLDVALTQYQTALGQFDTAQAMLQLKKNGATKEEIDQVRGQLRQARGALALARVQFDQSLIRAPIDGVVTQHVARVGEVATPAATVVKMVDLDRPHLTIYAPLPQLGRVKLGQKVAVTTDTFPGKTYRGEVYWISDTPEFTPRNVQTRDERVKLVFQVKVRVENPRRELKPGMPADAQIEFR